MDIRQSPLLLGFSLGYWLRTHVRVSFLFPLLYVVLCIRLGLALGLAVSAVLTVSIVIHEFCHVLAARNSGGSADEIILWPLGGLAMCAPAPTFGSEFWTVAAGPISNLVICLMTLPIVISHNLLSESLGLVILPPVELTQATFMQDAAALFFAINYRLLLINLLPIYPLDGGQMALSVAKRYRDAQTARLGTMWAGIIFCVILMAAGLMTEVHEISFLAFMLVIFVMSEYFSMQHRGHEEDSFLGYDFSQGYTSLERSQGAPEEETRRHEPGPIGRWLQRRRATKQRRAQERDAAVELQLDAILEKVHQRGIESLTAAERKLLNRASARFRQREQDH